MTHFFKTSSAIFTCIAVMLCLSCSKKNLPPNNNGGNDKDTVNSAKNFTISGTKILDPNGNEFIAKGINVNGPYWPWSRATVPDASLIIDVWKFNTVRVNCWPEFASIDNNNPDLDGIVQAFTTKKVVTLLEEHNFTGVYPTADQLNTLITWWVGIATKYKDNPYVWFNIMNEPGPGGDVAQTWSDDHEAVIKAIRATGANNIIVCDEAGSGQASAFSSPASSAALTYGPALIQKYKNVMFSLHTYDQWVYGGMILKNYLDAVAAKNLAVIIGEYGTGNTDISCEVSTSVFKNCIPAKIGRIGWHWDGVDIYKLTTSGDGGGFSIDNTSGTKPGNLGFVGNLVWDDNHAGIDLSGTEVTPPPVEASNLNFETNATNGSGISGGWINFGTATFDSTPANVSQGTYSVKIAGGAAGGCGQPIYLAPNTTYKVTAWGKHSAIPSSASSLGFKANGSNDAFGSLDFTETVGTVKTATFTTPATLTAVFMYIYKNDAAPDFWMDNIIITKQ